MKRLLFAIWFTLLAVMCQGQVWHGFGNTVQWQKVTIDTTWRIGGGSGANAFVQMLSRFQVNKLINARPVLPIGLRGQTLAAVGDNSNNYLAVEPLIYGQFIYTDHQRDSAFTLGSSKQLEIFNSFKRYSHGGSQTIVGAADVNNYIPGQPSQVASWAYDTISNNIKTTFNSGSVLGFVSNEDAWFDAYTNQATITSTAADNDVEALVIAFVEDPYDLVPNRAFGMTGLPGINTTSELIPNQHSLTVTRNRNGAPHSYSIWYDYQKIAQKVVVDGSYLSGLFTTNNNWSGASVDLRVERHQDTVICTTSNFSDAPGGKGSLRFPITINLNSDTALYKFKGKHAYGYAVHSQANSTFSNIQFSGDNNLIYDLRQGDVYRFTSSGYIVDPDKNMYIDLGTRFFWRNKTFKTLGYILPNGTYDVIIGQTP